MPSRPMLTTPARSDHSPPRPASRIGSSSRTAACAVPLDVSCDLAGEGHRDRQDQRSRSPRRAPSAPSRGGATSAAGRRRRPRSARAVTASAPVDPTAAGSPDRGAQLRGDPALLGGQLVAPDDLVGDDHGQHDRPLHDQHDLPRHTHVVQGQRGLVEERPEQRPERHPDGVVAAQQRDGDAGEPVARRGVQRVREVSAEQLGQPHQAGDRAGQEQRDDHHPPGVHPARRRGGGRLAGGLEVEAEAGALEQEPVAHAETPPRGRSARRACRSRRAGCRAPGRSAAIGWVEMLLPRSTPERVRADQEGDQARRDEVQHDRRDDLADPAVGLEQRRDAGPRRTCQRADEQDHERCAAPAAARPPHRRSRRRTRPAGTGPRCRC